MITVFRGNEKITCTAKTYEEQLKPLGYQIASEDKEATNKVASFEKEEDKKDDNKEEIVDYEKELTKKYQINKTSGKKKK